MLIVTSTRSIYKRMYIFEHDIYLISLVLTNRPRSLQWQAPLEEVVEGKAVCPYCSGKEVVPGFNSFAALYPELLKKFSADNDFDPDKVFPNSRKTVNWECQTHGLQWRAPLKEVVEGKAVCPYCSGKEVVPGFNSFAALYPYLSKKFSADNDFDPDQVFPSSRTSAIWKCQTHGLQWQAPLNEVVEGKAVCPYCSGKEVVPGVTSFKALYPEITKNEWKYISNALISDPDYVLPSSTQQFFWECRDCGTTYISSPKRMVQNMQRKIKTCNYCKGLRTKYSYY